MACYNYYSWQQAFPNVYTSPAQAQAGQRPGYEQQQATTVSHATQLFSGAESGGRQAPINQENASHDIHLKLLNPANKQDYKMFVLRKVCMDKMDSPDKLKDLIIDQCGDAVTKCNLEIGYFRRSKKFWLNNRLDMNDFWELILKGESITLWCVETTEHSRKRTQPDASEDEYRERPKKLSKVEERKSEAEKFEKVLSEKHGDKFSPFQYKLWAEMYVGKTHQSLEEPPAAAMFKRDTKQPKKRPDLSTTSVDGVLTVMNTLCQALATANKQTEAPAPSPTFSPMKRAQLRSTYLKQLSELRDLHDAGVLHQDEYEEQRSDIVNLMRQLK